MIKINIKAFIIIGLLIMVISLSSCYNSKSAEKELIKELEKRDIPTEYVTEIDNIKEKMIEQKENLEEFQKEQEQIKIDEDQKKIEESKEIEQDNIDSNDPKFIELQSKISKINENPVKKGGYSFTYSYNDDSLKNQESNLVNVAKFNEFIKLDYGVHKEDSDKYRYTSIYIDTKFKTMHYSCDVVDRFKCPEGITSKQVDYDETIIPKDPLTFYNLFSSATFVSNQKYGGRDTLVFEQNMGEYNLRITIDSYFGMPLLLQEIYTSKRIEYRYNDMAINSVDMSDVTLKE
jgi:hypothetical protein